MRRMQPYPAGLTLRLILSPSCHFGPQHNIQVLASDRIRRVDAQRALELGFCLVEISELEEYEPEIPVRFIVVRIYSDDTLIFSFRSLQFFLQPKNVAQNKVRFLIVGPNFQGSAEMLDRLLLLTLSLIH